MKLPHYEISFDEKAWNEQSQRTNIQRHKKYTSRVAQIQPYVDELDRYDDFKRLVISPSAYAKTEETGVYGIKKDNNIHGLGGNVVLDHQVQAAKQFLGEHRGFGLLADLVGSGKTFEAGIVLSELAARNFVSTMLIVTPGQVFDSWVHVLEECFGMGKGVLYQVRAPREDSPLPAEGEFASIMKKVGYTAENRPNGVAILPKRPIIVDVKVFSRWQLNNTNVVFDVIVVDEAHNLCKEDGEYARAMKLLSELMEIKKEMDSPTYCLLLSATPHSGNLQNMFRLWYFVRCKGGNPSDFEEKEDRYRSEEYLKEKQYYHDTVCYGATNVTDFIRVVKLREFDSTKSGRFVDKLRRWNKYPSDFDNLSDYAKSKVVDEFLESNPEIRSQVEEIVSESYHALLRTIMVRQPKNKLAQSHQKIVRNILFYPVPQSIHNKLMRFTFDDIIVGESKKVTLDFGAASVSNGFLPTATCDGETKPLMQFVSESRNNKSEKDAFCDVFREALGKFNAVYTEATGRSYSKNNYVSYYVQRLRAAEENFAPTALLPVAETDDKLGYKFRCFKEIVNANVGKRIIVFFDYEINKKESIIDDVAEALKRDPTIAPRLLLSSDADEKTVINKFNERDDAILLVTTPALTEGANLQTCNVIVNYQVTPDPLAMDQRIGRVFRLGQTEDVTIYSLADVNKLEGFALAYFIAIGLMSTNSGDATILAGSNSDQMVTVRCKVCGNVKLMSRQEYEEQKDNLICNHDGTPFHTAKSSCRMEEINVNEFKCDRCGAVLERSAEEGYECLSDTNDGQRGKLCTDAEKGNRTVYCSKICSMRHCEKLKRRKCPVLERFGEPASKLWLLCNKCNLCSEAERKCRLSTDVSACTRCPNSGCRPTPYVLHFNEKWEAPCPRCNENGHSGILRPVIPKTFVTYIRNLWNFKLDNGDSFCYNLDKEAQKVEQINRILKNDRNSGGR